MIEVDLQGILNFRDLASAAPGLAPGRVYRSARPCFATDADVAALRDVLGVRALVDLRSPKEVEHATSVPWPVYDAVAAGAWAHRRVPLIDQARFQQAALARLDMATRLQVGVDVLRGGKRRALDRMRPAVNAAGLAGLYEIFLEAGGRGIAAALAILADDAQTPALLFCTAGKDRTGLVSALALSVARVDEAAICADYALSQACYEAFVADEHYGGIVERLHLDAAEFLGARAETMARTFGFLRARYGGVAGYLDHVGVDAGARDRLRRRLRGG